MSDEAIPDELHRACKNLCERFEMLGIKTVTVPRGEWDVLPLEIQQAVPAWLREIHATYPLGHSVLRTVEWNDNSGRDLRFFLPQDMTALFREYFHHRLIKFGYCPFADEGNQVLNTDDCWVFRIKDGTAASIYWLSATAWDGSEEGLKDALTYASPRLALLLCSMELGGNSIETPPPVMWVWETKADDSEG
jgi:hypothetical protein